MRSFMVIVLQVFLAEMIEVPGSKDHELIKTFLANRLHEAFNVGVRVWGPKSLADRFYFLLLEEFIELAGELGIPVMLDKANR